MKVSEKLTQQNFREILVNMYLRGIETENIKLIEFIEEIKQQVLLFKND